MRHALLSFIVALAFSQPELASGADILYVNQNDPAATVIWETAFQDLGIAGNVDRVDIGVSLHESIADVVSEIAANYRVILWDCGNLNIISDDPGPGPNISTDDWELLNIFLAQEYLPPVGVYICGDDVVSALYESSMASAVTFKTSWIPFILTSTDHVPLFGVDPTVQGLSGGPFDGQSYVAVGTGTPTSDFDVMDPTGPSTMAASYDVPTTSNGAVLRHGTTNRVVVVSGFSFTHVDEFTTVNRHGTTAASGQTARALYLASVLADMGYPLPPTGVGEVGPNYLAQNYPNPFNPQTVVTFSLRKSGRVTLKVYSMSGELVRTLVDDGRAAGHNQATWDGRNELGQPVSSGVYFARLVAPEFTATRKMVLLK